MSSTLTIRKVTESDVPALSYICLQTADAGKSAEKLHDYGELPGLVYAVPYAKLPYTWGFVLVEPDPSSASSQDGEGKVVGYILGGTNTRSYEHYASEHWWPSLVKKYPPSMITDSTKPDDARHIRLLGNMHTAPEGNIRFASAHMHIDILAEHQGRGWGTKLVATAITYLKELAESQKDHIPPPDTLDDRVLGDGLWLGLDLRNEGAKKFYAKLGFKQIEGSPEGNLGIKFKDFAASL